jgi:phosphotransferase system HPr (HPr) family protein
MSEDAISREVEILNEYGFHFVPAGKFVNIASQYSADITVEREGFDPVPGKSIIALVTIEASKGCKIKINATGTDAQQAVEALADLVDSKFGE